MLKLATIKEQSFKLKITAMRNTVLATVGQWSLH